MCLQATMMSKLRNPSLQNPSTDELAGCVRSSWLESQITLCY
uniref:Uncharacterized protein n=1 Tax=Kalanchoe fedtschenkoi TaxID=63787 RepID=A0A7N0VA97_KALFE